MKDKMQKIIWQTHEWEYSDLPKNFLATSMTWKNLNPSWEYRYVSAAQRVIEVKKFDTVLYKFYLLSAPVTQADIWRYVAVYLNGGVYADMDSICITPLDYLIETKYQGEELMATPKDSKGDVNNANFMATEKSTVIKAVLETTKERYKNMDYYPALVEAEDKDQFWNLLKTYIRTSPEHYSPVVLQYPEIVSFNFEAAIHDETFKKSFNLNYLVNYYGTYTHYFDLAKKHGWVTHINACDTAEVEAVGLEPTTTEL